MKDRINKMRASKGSSNHRKADGHRISKAAMLGQFATKSNSVAPTLKNASVTSIDSMGWLPCFKPNVIFNAVHNRQ